MSKSRSIPSRADAAARLSILPVRRSTLLRRPVRPPVDVEGASRAFEFFANFSFDLRDAARSVLRGPSR